MHNVITRVVLTWWILQQLTILDYQPRPPWRFSAFFLNFIFSLFMRFWKKSGEVQTNIKWWLRDRGKFCHKDFLAFIFSWSAIFSCCHFAREDAKANSTATIRYLGFFLSFEPSFKITFKISLSATCCGCTSTCPCQFLHPECPKWYFDPNGSLYDGPSGTCN